MTRRLAAAGGRLLARRAGGAGRWRHRAGAGLSGRAGLTGRGAGLACGLGDLGRGPAGGRGVLELRAEGQGTPAGRDEQAHETRDPEQQRGHSPAEPVAIQQVDTGGPDEKLGEQRGRPAPGPDPVEPVGDEGHGQHRAERDDGERDPAAVVVGAAGSSVRGGQHGDDEEPRCLDGLDRCGHQQRQRTWSHVSHLSTQG